MRQTAEDFGAAFADLLRSAGMNPDKLVRELARQNRSNLVTRTTLYDWRSGAHLPEDESTFLAVVRTCMQLARERGGRALHLTEEADWAQLLAEARRSRVSASARNPGRTEPRSGKPSILARDWDPVALGVHIAIGGNSLPEYVRREHDDLLDAVMDPDVTDNRLVVLRGGTSVGKSRSAYQAVSAGQLASWRLEYPLTPSGLARRIVDGVPSRTILWLGELRDYADSERGAEALEKLAGLLMHRHRIIAITTLWPDFWDVHTGGGENSGPGTPRRYLATRVLLTGLPVLTTLDEVDPRRGGVLDVRPEFTHNELTRARQCHDPALSRALDVSAREFSPARVTQYLAGVPDLLRHYQSPGADPYGCAVITAAMDASRLGWRQGLTPEFLHEAAIGYLSDEHRVIPADAWHTTAFEYATRELRGAVRALKPVPPVTGTGIAAYQLADVLDQHARDRRAGTVPPCTFWNAIVNHAPPFIQSLLADTAEEFGLLRYAAQLAKNAVPAEGFAANQLIRLFFWLAPADERPAQWAVENVDLSEPWAFRYLLAELREEGRDAQIAALLDRVSEVSIEIYDASDVAELLKELRTAGRDTQVAMLLNRNIAAYTKLSSDTGVISLLEELRAVGADWQAEALLERGRAMNIEALLRKADDPDARKRLSSLMCNSIANIDIENPGLVARRLKEFRIAGSVTQAAMLLNRDPATHARLRLPGALASLAWELHQAEAHDQFAILINRILSEDAADMAWSDLLSDLLLKLRKVGKDTQAANIALRAVSHAHLTDAREVFWIAEALKEVDDSAALTALLDRNPEAHVELGQSYPVAGLLKLLREEGYNSQLAMLISRNPANHVALDYPDGVGRLLIELRNAGEDQQVSALAMRIPDAAGNLCNGDDGDGMQRLLEALHDVGADSQMEALIARIPPSAQFDLLYEYSEEYYETHKFGREPDGRPAAPWEWADLT